MKKMSVAVVPWLLGLGVLSVIFRLNSAAGALFILGGVAGAIFPARYQRLQPFLGEPTTVILQRLGAAAFAGLGVSLLIQSVVA
jgi:hypothetical protein